MGNISSQQKIDLLGPVQYAKCPYAGKYTYHPGPFTIDPEKEYPISYQQFMTPIGFWDLHGPTSIFDELSQFLTEEEVAEQVEKQRVKQLQQKEKEVKALEQKLRKEFQEWEQLKELAHDEIDTTDISTQWNQGSDPRIKMQDSIKNDIESLEHITNNTITEADLQLLHSQNPNVIMLIFSKIFDFLSFLSNIEVVTEDGQVKNYNIYEVFLDKLIEQAKAGNNGKVPKWLETFQMIFKFGKQMANEELNGDIPFQQKSGLNKGLSGNWGNLALAAPSSPSQELTLENLNLF